MSWVWPAKSPGTARTGLILRTPKSRTRILFRIAISVTLLGDTQLKFEPHEHANTAQKTAAHCSRRRAHRPYMGGLPVRLGASRSRHKVAYPHHGFAQGRHGSHYQRQWLRQWRHSNIWIE